MPIISNTSPLINLAVTGRLSLLQQQFGEIIIPQAVYEECRIDENLPGTDELSAAIRARWLSVRKLSRQDEAILLKRELDKGEAEAIALALELKAELVLIDERDARRVCGSLGLKVTGVVGVLVRAYRSGAIASLEEALIELREKAGFYITDQLLNDIVGSKNG